MSQIKSSFYNLKLEVSAMSKSNERVHNILFQHLSVKKIVTQMSAVNANNWSTVQTTLGGGESATRKAKSFCSSTHYALLLKHLKAKLQEKHKCPTKNYFPSQKSTSSYLAVANLMEFGFQLVRHPPTFQMGFPRIYTTKLTNEWTERKLILRDYAYIYIYIYM